MIHVALKEWAIVCDLLMAGQLSILLRKGGIHEDAGAGEFRLQHDHFAFFPSWAHQKPEMMKPQHRGDVKVLQEPAEVTVQLLGSAEQIWQVPSRKAMDSLNDLHCWSEAQIDMRFDYKPDHPLYLIAVRCRKLAQPRVMVNDWEYGGCRSWIPLKPHDAIDDSASETVLSDDAFESIVQQIERAFSD